LLAATLYQGNPDRNNKLWNIVSTERYEREYVESFIELFYLSEGCDKYQTPTHPHTHTGLIQANSTKTALIFQPIKYTYVYIFPYQIHIR
jgi:hypothetical protein